MMFSFLLSFRAFFVLHRVVFEPVVCVCLPFCKEIEVFDIDGNEVTGLIAKLESENGQYPASNCVDEDIMTMCQGGSQSGDRLTITWGKSDIPPNACKTILHPRCQARCISSL
jgi:hypothetical protein